MFPHVVLIILLAYLPKSLSVNVNVNTASPVRTIQDKFLSVAYDSGHAFAANLGINFRYIAPLAKALGPAYFRFGGGEADTLLFQVNKTLNPKIYLENATETIFTGL
uniref:Uncharacterized protein n=1 Tax=Acrobeloides nanus TaxID=290746 RepID=A0A914D9R8_9BILA